MEITTGYEGEFIQLNQLLKRESIVMSGGEAKCLIEENKVLVNGEIETRIRRKLVRGDVIEVRGNKIILE